MKVLKFGGTSVASAKTISQVRNIVADEANNEQLLVVVSALGGVTNILEEIIHTATINANQAMPLLDQLADRHLQTAKELFDDNEINPIEKHIIQAREKLAEMVKGVSIVGELTPKVKDRVISMGERLSSFIIWNFFNKEFPTELLDPQRYILTDDNYGNATVLNDLTYEKIASLSSNDSRVLICPGFIGATEDGMLTTLGRGGSDFTAALFARGLMANELQIWTDVSGMMTADPRIVKTAKVISELSYEEAMELSHFGAKVIYPPTIQPVLKKAIPIKIKNTLKPEDNGTLITKENTPTDKTVQGLTSINNLALVNLKGASMVGVPKVSYRLFRAFAKHNINIILITQASSEHTITIAITEADTEAAAKAVRKEFSMEIELGKIDPLEIEKGLAVVALVGSNMRNQVGVSGKMFSTLAANGVNIKAIAQGSSELNISTVIYSNDLKKAINSLHENFFLSERKRINLFIIGVGNVGGELLLQLKNQIPVLLKEEYLDIRVVGLANSKKMVFAEEGVELNEWHQYLDGGEPMNKNAFVNQMTELNLRNSVFIDNTATGDIPELYTDILKSSISVVTPNKIAASASYEQYREIKKTARDYRAQFLFETNVGAGLPIISTLNDLVKSGDKIMAIEAVLSGSLNFIFNNYDGSKDFATIVKQALDEGYTEPDPRIDLSGLDVKRKLLILMREAGIACEIEDIEDEQFIPEASFEANESAAFFSVLKDHEVEFEQMLKKANKNGSQLKFVAQYREGKAIIKLVEIEQGHPFSNLEGKDNIVLFYTRRYQDQPLIIKGAGAGAEVTASGIFADVIKVAHSKPSNL